MGRRAGAQGVLPALGAWLHTGTTQKLPELPPGASKTRSSSTEHSWVPGAAVCPGPPLGIRQTPAAPGFLGQTFARAPGRPEPKYHPEEPAGTPPSAGPCGMPAREPVSPSCLVTLRTHASLSRLLALTVVLPVRGCLPVVGGHKRLHPGAGGSGRRRLPPFQGRAGWRPGEPEADEADGLLCREVLAVLDTRVH